MLGMFCLNALDRHEVVVELDNGQPEQNAFRRKCLVDTDYLVAITEVEIFAADRLCASPFDLRAQDVVCFAGRPRDQPEIREEHNDGKEQTTDKERSTDADE